MPQQLQAPLHSVQVRASTKSLQKRLAALRDEDASANDWRQLQFDSMREYLSGQRRFIALHTELLTVLTADRELHRRQRHEALELFLALAELHDLVRAIGAQLTASARDARSAGFARRARTRA